MSIAESRRRETALKEPRSARIWRGVLPLLLVGEDGEGEVRDGAKVGVGAGVL